MNLKKKVVAVLFGSVSSEYEVSLMSATSVLQNIPREKYDVVMLGITKDGRWLEYTGDIALIQPDQWQQSGHVTPAVLSPDRSTGGLLRILPDGRTSMGKTARMAPYRACSNWQESLMWGAACSPQRPVWTRRSPTSCSKRQVSGPLLTE